MIKKLFLYLCKRRQIEYATDAWDANAPEGLRRILVTFHYKEAEAEAKDELIVMAPKYMDVDDIERWYRNIRFHRNYYYQSGR